MGRDLDAAVPEEERERLSDQAWVYQRERQLRDLGIDPDAVDT